MWSVPYPNSDGPVWIVGWTFMLESDLGWPSSEQHANIVFSWLLFFFSLVFYATDAFVYMHVKKRFQFSGQKKAKKTCLINLFRIYIFSVNSELIWIFLVISFIAINVFLLKIVWSLGSFELRFWLYPWLIHSWFNV